MPFWTLLIAWPVLHERVRKDLWGYAPNEDLSNPDLIAEKYAGIRPAPGYPACPDHTEKATIFSLLGAERPAEPAAPNTSFTLYRNRMIAMRQPDPIQRRFALRRGQGVERPGIRECLES